MLALLSILLGVTRRRSNEHPNPNPMHCNNPAPMHDSRRRAVASGTTIAFRYAGNRLLVGCFWFDGGVVMSLVIQCKTQVNGEVVTLRIPGSRTTAEAINAFEQYIKAQYSVEFLNSSYPLDIKLVPAHDG